MKIITYSLLTGRKDAAKYYEDAARFAEAVLKHGKQLAGTWATAFKQFTKECQLEKLRSEEEYILEILTLGVLWLRYSDDAVVLNLIPRETLQSLVEMRQKGGVLKSGADFIRGILGTVFLYAEHKPGVVKELKFTYDNFIRLKDWLAASGEFVQEVKRFDKWSEYLASLEVEEASDFIADAVSYAIWFEQKSLEALGYYTQGVENYLKEAGTSHRWREDLILCCRQRVEYHLNMVGAEIMNRAYRADFIRTDKKVVLLPACIRRKQDGTCKCREVAGVLYCASCDSSCQVFQIKKMGKSYGYEVLIIPHESSAFSNSNMKEGELGIIGIACVINLLAGGWKAKGYGIPAQCVLLDYCGCKNHWDEEGFPTVIDMQQLEKVMDTSQMKISYL